jgi:hypothetical protein
MIKNRSLLAVIILSVGMIFANIGHASLGYGYDKFQGYDKITAEQLLDEYNGKIVDYQGILKSSNSQNNNNWSAREDVLWIFYSAPSFQVLNNSGYTDSPYEIICKLDDDYAIRDIKLYKKDKITDSIPGPFWSNNQGPGIKLEGWIKKLSL